MAKLLALAIAFVSFFAACSRPPAAPTQPNAVHVAMHADTAFTAVERELLQLVLDQWLMQTGGLANIKLVYDLDLDHAKAIPSGHLLVRMESWMYPVRELEGPDGPSLLGLVSPSGGIHNPQEGPLHMWLIADRLNSASRFKAVALHEFGHVLGMNHIPNRYAVMYPGNHGQDPCLTLPDLNEYCRVNRCGGAVLKSCGD